MIDILCVAYSNYRLFYENIFYHLNLSSEFQFIVCDATSKEHGREEFVNLNHPRIEVVDYIPHSDYDGESHGDALDLLVSKSTSSIIGTLDHDFFWLRPDIVEWVYHLFGDGYKAVGAAGWYPTGDWIASIDKNNPDRQGHMAPVCWGQFLSRDLAVSESFVVRRDEGPHGYETGWRIRQKIVQEGIKNLTLPGFQFPKQEDMLAGYFGMEGFPVGLHLLKGINRTSDQDFINLAKLMKRGRAPWLS